MAPHLAGALALHCEKILMPIQILKDIQPHHLPMIWRELQKKYGFNTTEWETSFEQAFERTPRGTEKVEFFLVFGVQAINPILNRIHHRPFDYPTFIRLAEAVIAHAPASGKPA